jgi:DNA helicase II / ATP-dependent DNA helicase PcrA
MIRRVTRLLARSTPADAALSWAGTFHAIANRLLRHHAPDIGLDPSFTLLDREDAADLLDRLRHEQGLSRTDRRFPRKGTCLAIYSSVVNTQDTLRTCLETRFSWCLEWEEPLRGLFAAYVDAKAARAVLDYDDLVGAAESVSCTVQRRNVLALVGTDPRAYSATSPIGWNQSPAGSCSVSSKTTGVA